MSNKILIVDDEQDITEFIQYNLQKEGFLTEVASDGLEALKKADSFKPDLILLDVMMPKMDGIEMCAKIKTDERTSHIPVILLTAKADLESKLEGLETGADAYITKPFETQELLVRIKNLIEQRELLRVRYQKDMDIVPAGLNLSSVDEQFLVKATGIVKDHLSDESFNVDILSSMIFMSRQHLNRKLRSITGRTAVEFIRLIRLKQAALLLLNNHSTVTEATYAVGIGSQAHFSKAFKEEFGISPSEYLAQHKTEEKE